MKESAGGKNKQKNMCLWCDLVILFYVPLLFQIDIGEELYTILYISARGNFFGTLFSFTIFIFILKKFYWVGAKRSLNSVNFILGLDINKAAALQIIKM